jgi:FHA domain-containing protein
MARLLIKSGGTGTQAIELKPGVNRVGRNPECDHLIDDPAVSESHCEILLENGFVLVRDLGSTNGTFIEQQPITESALYNGQTLQVGPLEMVLEAPPPRVALPEMPFLEPQAIVSTATRLTDGYEACLNHEGRHAIWECTHCLRFYCDTCIRRLRRVGGKHIKLCPACSFPCKLSPWSQWMKNKKKSLVSLIAGKFKDGFKRTVKLIAPQK